MHSPDVPAADRPAARPFTRRLEAIGTHWQIDTDRDLRPAEWSALHSRIDEFDRTYSRFRTDSLVHRLAQTPGTVEFPDDAAPLMAFYRRLYEGTGGAVTPLVGGTLSDLGYDGDYRFVPAATVRRTPDWDDAMSWDGPVVTTTRPLVLDVGAAGKGYLVDILGGLLDSFGVGSFVVDGSGDLLHRAPVDGADGIRVGLEHPHDAGKVIGVLPLSDDAVAASAGNRRTWAGGLHHFIDPRTGKPAGEVIATWVVAGSAMIADGLATALFFTDRHVDAVQPADPRETRALADTFGADWLRVLADGSAHWSPTFEGELFR